MAEMSRAERDQRRVEGHRMWEDFGSLVGARYVHGMFPAKRGPAGGTGPPRRPRGWFGSYWLSDSDGAVRGQFRRRWKTHLWIGEHHFQRVRQPHMQSESTILVEMDTHEVVADIKGNDFSRDEPAILALRGGPTVSYSVWGATKGDCVMVAQDSGGHRLAHFRWVRETLGWSCEIVVPPGSLAGDDLALMLLLGGKVFRDYWEPHGG